MMLMEEEKEKESCWILDDEKVRENDAVEGASLDILSSPTRCISNSVIRTSHIEVYSFYEIDRTKLPVNAPDQLKSIRIVMVTEESKTRVALRFPSNNSLRLYLRDCECVKEEGVNRVPSLDEKYFLEPEVAGEVLYRRVSSDDIGEKKKLWSFWVVSSGSGSGSCDVDNEKKGLCCFELLENPEMVKWGKRKKVHYYKKEGEPVSYDGVEGKEEVEAVKSIQLVNGGTSQCKRKCIDVNELSKKKKNKFVKYSNSRWSKERYKLAELNIWKVLKKKNAVYVKPILRPELRTEARKLIGDSGLLDHLLKHMAGKVAPGGQDRFRRRHNADGAMEYWLENAELVNIRKQIGVQDPYWTPPPGWKPGDNPAQDPICAREFKQLKENMSELRMEMRVLLSKKQEDNLPIVATPCLNNEHDNFSVPLNEIYAELMNKKAKLDEQMMEILQSLRKIEEEMEMRKSAVTEQNKPAESAITSYEEPGHIHKITKETTELPIEDRASKIKRLKSGFTICKPQGSFLWPNMALSLQPNKVASKLEDLCFVPSPSSISSFTASSSPHHLISPLGPPPNFLVKPLPERRPVTVTWTSALSRPIRPLPPEAKTQFETVTSTAIITTGSSTRTAIIDLNEISGSHTYQSRNQLETIITTTNSIIPCLETPGKNADIRQGEEFERKEILMECEQKLIERSSSISSSSSSPCLLKVSGN